MDDVEEHYLKISKNNFTSLADIPKDFPVDPESVLTPEDLKELEYEHLFEDDAQNITIESEKDLGMDKESLKYDLSDNMNEEEISFLMSDDPLGEKARLAQISDRNSIYK